MRQSVLKELLFVIKKDEHEEQILRNILTKHTEIKFVSLIGIDLFGNDTDERIPIKVFIDDIKTFLSGAIQTDGSSVVLPGIASLNNAKVDLVADLNVNWYIDHNYENTDPETGKPVGTLRIPCFLFHENQPVDSRHILKRTAGYVKTLLTELFKKYPESIEQYGVKPDEIDDIITTSGTELEFWVKTPDIDADVEELSTSQVLQEQYWTRVMGSVRTSLEQSLIYMDYYELNPEMGHKEVGGVRAKLDVSGNLTSIMEQLEIDWKFSEALQAADNELLAKMIVREVFRRYGLDVTFLAKPIEGVAGSGEHTHIGVMLKLKNGKKVNLFTGHKNHFMSIFGYAAIMGILKNYEVINPMVSSTNDSLRRLKPGFEAPISIVTSLGHSAEMPSRNRTVLIGLVKDLLNPLSTRFELRAPNPHTNSYMAISSLYMALLDGIKYAVENKKTDDDLLKEISKKYGEKFDYLETDREYRSEEDIFEDYTEEERNKLFGKTPATIYENLSAFEKYPSKLNVLKEGGVFNDKLINSFAKAVISRWITEIDRRIIPNYIDEIRDIKILHNPNNAVDLDYSHWTKVDEQRKYIMKDTHSGISLISKTREAIKEKNYEEVSRLQIELDTQMSLLRENYHNYKRNIINL
jgi:glutamine synthetase